MASVDRGRGGGDQAPWRGRVSGRMRVLTEVSTRLTSEMLILNYREQARAEALEENPDLGRIRFRVRIQQ